MSDKERRQRWRTPDDFFELLDREFAFDIDVAADSVNTKCQHWIQESNDALTSDWFHKGERYWVDMFSAWCNPPYKDPKAWIDKAAEETDYIPGSVAVLLLNHDASTAWYQRAINTASEIRILTNRRIQFIAPDGVKASSNAKAQCVIVFRKKQASAPCHVWHWDWSADLEATDES
jgi:phage N-6-adenine-methyltransferase